MDGSDHGGTSAPVARPGPGRFQWSGGGWVGSVLVPALWLVVGSLLLASKSAETARLWAVCGGLSIAAGFWLWRQRDRILPYPAVMAMLLVHWIAACVAILGLLVLAPRAAQPFEPNPWIALAGFLVFPQLMIQFTLMERSAKRPPEGTQPKGLQPKESPSKETPSMGTSDEGA